MYNDPYNMPTKEERKAFWSGALRMLLCMLFYGGIATIVGKAATFGLSLALEYSYWKPEISEYTGLAITVILYPLLFGFKHAVNCGYIDSFDGIYSKAKFAKQFLAANVAAIAIPMMVAASANFIFIAVYTLCYGASDGISELISEAFFHKYDGTTSLGIVIGTLVTYAAYFPLALPFYSLGRRHHERDIANGVKIKVT